MTAGLIDLYPNRGLRFVRGEGAYLFTADGRRFLDLMSNYGVSIFGYGHRAISAAVARQFESLPTLHGSFVSDVRVRASLALAKRLPIAGAALCWSNSGTEAIEAALKFAVLATGKQRIVACRNGYHGKTLGALSATDSAKYRGPFEPLLWDFEHVEYGSIEAMERAVNDRTAAIIVEPIQGEGGIIVPPPGYLAAVRELANAAGVLMIVDEIQTGCGRTGRFLACGHEAVTPDIVCLGKGLAGGIPVGATAVSAAISERVPRGLHTSTFGGSPLACAGVLAVLELMTDDLLESVARLGETFASTLRAIPSSRVCEVCGRGLMLGVKVASGRDEILKALQHEEVLAIPAGSDVVRFLPPYIVTGDELAHACDVMARVLAR